MADKLHFCKNKMVRNKHKQESDAMRDTDTTWLEAKMNAILGRMDPTISQMAAIQPQGLVNTVEGQRNIIILVTREGPTCTYNPNLQTWSRKRRTTTSNLAELTPHPQA